MNGGDELEKAVAIKYLKELPAPYILAKGRGEMARKIKETAENSGVEIVREDALAEGLYKFENGDFIPEEFYEITAGILAFVYNLQDMK